MNPESYQNELQFKSSSKILDIILGASSAFYLMIYLFLRAHGGAFILRDEGNTILVLVKNALNYGIFSDPIPVLLGGSLFLYRAYQIFVKKEKAHPIYDSMLFAAMVYMSAFFVLRMYGPYYYLPTNALTLPPLLYYLTKSEYKKWFWKTAIGITMFFVAVNAVPSGIHYLTYYKYLQINFNQTLDFLVRDISSKKTGEKARIFLDGVDLAGGRGTFFVFGEFMEYRGLSPKQFDLLSRTPTPHPEPLISKIQPPYTAFVKDTPSEMKSGDYLVVTPQSTAIDNSPAYLESLAKDFRPVLRTESAFSFPSITLKALVKYAATRISKEKRIEGLVKSENIWDTPDYYVFVKK